MPWTSLVAHRGYARRYPENTIPAITAALDAGARYVEIDVQLTADLVPVVLHDDDLARVTGRPGAIAELRLDALADYAPAEPSRLGDAFAGVRIPTLADAARLVAARPGAFLFVELKVASLARAGIDVALDAVGPALAPLRGRAALISFDPGAIEAAAARGWPVGWVLPAWDDAARRRTESMRPAYVFVDHRRLPPADAPLWPGPWQWAVYEVDDADHARRLFARGVDLVETMAFAEMREALGPG